MNAEEKGIDEKIRASYQAALFEKDYDKAIALCREVIDLDPTCYQAWVNLASFSRIRAVFILKDEALPAYDKAIEFCSDDYILLKKKAEILSFLGEERDADKCLEQANKIYANRIYHVDGTDCVG